MLGMVGCAGTSKTPTFYLLEAMPESSPRSQPQGGVSVEVGPITLPAYLDRTQIATTGDQHVLYMDEFHRWAEPLKDSIVRILSENLAISLGTANVYQYPMRRKLPIDFQLEVTVSHFLAGADGNVTLVAYWAVLGNDGNNAMPRKRTAISRQARTEKLQSVVDAQNLVLQDLSKEIAATIQSLR
jgi:hypothetical protein